MSKRNYTQYSNSKKNNPTAAVEDVTTVTPVDETLEIKMEPVVETQAEVATPAINVVKETVETKPLPKTVTGIVANCAKLNVRSTPISSADIVTVLPVDTEVEVDVKGSTPNWLRVTTATGIEGYCMRQFVNATL